MQSSAAAEVRPSRDRTHVEKRLRGNPGEAEVSITASQAASLLEPLLFDFSLFDFEEVSFFESLEDESEEVEEASLEVSLLGLPLEEEYPSEYQPLPLSAKDVREMRRFTLRDRQLGQVFTGSALMRCSTSNSCSHFPQAYS